MAVYRKKLVDKDGNTIIPAVGDIYGTVYTATLSSATAGGRADYEFTPDTPLESNKIYAVKFPAPTVNNATIILGDGVSSGSILVPPVAATDSPNYELLNTDMINDTEPLLLMYNGVQWVCLNQKKKVATADLENGAVTSNKIDWATLLPKLFKAYEMPPVERVTPSAAWKNYNMGNPLTVNGLDPDATYTVIASTPWSEGRGEFRLNITGANSYQQRPYNSTGVLIPVVYQMQGVKPTSSGSLTFQRSYSGEVFQIRTAQLYINLIRTA